MVSIKKNKNKFKQGDKKSVPSKQNIDENKMKTQINGKIFCIHESKEYRLNVHTLHVIYRFNVIL